jgi:hypothetical protein
LNQCIDKLLVEIEWGWLKETLGDTLSGTNAIYKSEIEGNLSAYFRNILPDNRIAQKFSLSFFCYGISELARTMHEGVFHGLAIFTYGYLISAAIEKHAEKNYQNISWFESVMIKYFYFNAIMAFGCRLALILTKTSQDITFPIVILLFVPFYFVFIFIPAVPNGAYYFLYSIIFNRIIKFINFLDESVFSSISNMVLREVFAFASAAIIIFVFNTFIMDRLLEKIQWFVSRPIIWFINLMKKIFKKS